MRLTLPTDSAVRKGVPLYSGCYSYFPAALAGVAIHSKNGNDRHNPGEPLHHARGKSMDHADCIARHSMDLADMLARKVVWTEAEQKAILTEARALSWRALAWHQEIEEMFGAPLAPAARLPGNPINTQYYKDVQAGDGRKYPPTIERDVRRLSEEVNRTIDQFCETGRPAERSGLSVSDPQPNQCGQTLAQDRVSLRGRPQEPVAVPQSSGCGARLP